MKSTTVKCSNIENGTWDAYCVDLCRNVHVQAKKVVCELAILRVSMGTRSNKVAFSDTKLVHKKALFSYIIKQVKKRTQTTKVGWNMNVTESDK